MMSAAGHGWGGESLGDYLGAGGRGAATDASAETGGRVGMTRRVAVAVAAIVVAADAAV